MIGDLLYFAREARRRPFRFLLRKLRDRLLAFLRMLRAVLGGKPYSARLGPAPGTAALLFGPGELDAALTSLQELHPDELDRLVHQARCIADGEYAVLSQPLRLVPPIDWHQDFVSACRWPVQFHTRYRYADLLDLGHRSDVKIPWELGRLQFLPVLALGARLSGETRLVEKAASLLGDWSKSNPVGYGVGWAIGMEASLRAISLIWTAELLAHTPWEHLDRSGLRHSLAEHGRFIYRNLEYSDINGNHYTSCLLGLLYLGLYLPEERESRKWRRLALRELEREIALQVYPDGVCHEGSIPYHRLVLELFLHAAILCRRHGIELSRRYLERLEAMFDFVAAYTKPGGEAPVWGDADDGRVLRLGSQGLNDHRYLLAVGAALLGKPELWAGVEKLSPDAALLLGAGGVEALPVFSRHAEPQPQSQAFEHGGFFVLRRGEDYCLIDCGDVGLRGRGGHGHNDALSVELSLAGRAVWVDTGCSAYTRSLDDRLLSLSAASHNAVVIDGQEPAPLAKERLSHATACPVEVVSWAPETPCFVGRRLGDGEPSSQFVQREVRLGPESGFLRLIDRIEGEGRRSLRWHFHFAELWEAGMCGPGHTSLEGVGGERGRVTWSGIDALQSLTRSAFFPAYGLRRDRLCLELAADVNLPAKLEIELSIRVQEDMGKR